MLALVLSGILVTTQNGSELAREAWRDDGKVVTSDITAPGRKATLSIDRQKRTLHIEQNGGKTDVAIPDGAAALMNLHWAAYAVLAEQYAYAATPTAFKAVLGPDRAIDAVVTVKKSARGDRDVTVSVGPLEVHVTVDARGAVTHAAVPLQGIEVKPTTAAAPPVKRTPPAGVVEELFEVQAKATKLAGATWLPQKRDGKIPVVLVIAGSGPVDRDGNAGGMLRTDAYRQLAEALARRGIATIRYDKRGVGQSQLGGKLEELTFDDYVNDAAAMVALARLDERFSGVYVFGHSEGALIALKLAARTAVDGIISAAGPGRPVAELAKEQFARELPAADMKEYDSLITELRAGLPLTAKSEGLQILFQPSLARFLRGMLLTDPRPLAATYKGKLTVVQGDNDVQVTVDKDARVLAAAHPGARLYVLKDVAHPLKHETHRGSGQPSYQDPALPIDAGVVDAVVATVRGGS